MTGHFSSSTSGMLPQDSAKMSPLRRVYCGLSSRWLLFVVMRLRTPDSVIPALLDLDASVSLTCPPHVLASSPDQHFSPFPSLQDQNPGLHSLLSTCHSFLLQLYVLLFRALHTVPLKLGTMCPSPLLTAIISCLPLYAYIKYTHSFTLRWLTASIPTREEDSIIPSM